MSQVLRPAWAPGAGCALLFGRQCKKDITLITEETQVWVCTFARTWSRFVLAVVERYFHKYATTAAFKHERHLNISMVCP